MSKKYHFKTKPYSYQVDALRKMLERPKGGGLFMEMGTGKTKVAIDYAGCLEELGEIEQVLVLGPLSTLSVWDAEIRKHNGSNTLKWKVINYDKARMVNHLPGLRKYMLAAPTLLICDEAHRLKNPSSKTSKTAYVLGKMSRRSLVLTGTPITKHPLDVFGELRVIDDGILGSSYGAFKHNYGVWGGYGGYQLIKYIKLKELKKRVDPHIFLAKKEDCLDLPSRVHEVVPVDLHSSRRVYEQMARESVAQLENGELTDAPIILTRMLRLSQITGGYLRRPDDGYECVGDEKRSALSNLVEEMAEQDTTKLVIFTRFLAELKDAAEVCAEHGYRVLPFYGGVPAHKREARICEFDESEKPTAFVAQIQTGAEGISLTAANVAIFYSHTYEYVKFAQACDRLHRIGQRHPVTYYHLIARDTIDEAVWIALKTKKTVADLALSKPELLV